jgi:hypothetical protein
MDNSSGNFGFESFTALSGSMPLQFLNSTYKNYFSYFGNTQYLQNHMMLLNSYLLEYWQEIQLEVISTHSLIQRNLMD